MPFIDVSAVQKYKKNPNQQKNAKKKVRKDTPHRFSLHVLHPSNLKKHIFEIALTIEMYNPKQEAPMKKKIATLTMMCCMTSSALFAQCKIMSYNIRNGRGMDEVCNYQRIADAILCEMPDVVAVQEVDSMTNRSNHTYVLGEIASLTNMHGSFAPAIHYDGGKYGIGILYALFIKIPANPRQGK